MLTERTNLELHLKKLQLRAMSEAQILEEVEKILGTDKGKQVQQRIRSDASCSRENQLNFEVLETDRIFHLTQIKDLCTQFRLRFLSTKYYKGQLPREAISAVQELESLHKTTLIGFHIIAPAKFFRLENADDPLLFIPIGNNYFYLVHKWGNDVHPLRRILVWPLKNLENLLISIFAFSFLLTFGIREVFFSRFQSTSEFLILLLYTIKSVIALIFFYGISLGKNFSSGNWNSKFYN